MEKVNLFYIDSSSRSAVLLGYKMHLTRTEFDILAILYGSEEYLSGESIASSVLKNESLGKDNISVHICSVNRKAKTISGRNLIECKRYKGYKIADKI